MKTLLRSFAGGEIAPEMFGRLDLGKYQTGLQKALNFRTLPHGPATRRSGLFYVNQAKDSSSSVRLIPFVFNATQAVVLELGHQYVRFHNAAGTVLETAVPITSITQANPGAFTRVAHGFLTGDVVFVSGALGMTAINGQFYTVNKLTADTYELRYLNVSTSISTVALPAYTGGGTAARVYTVATPWTGTDLATLSFAQDADVLTVSSSLYATREIRRLAATNWTVTSASFTPTLAAPGGVGAVATIPTPTNPVTQSYVVTSVAADAITESVASSAATCANNLTIFGNFNTISWSAATGAARYYVYRLRGGSYGYIGQTTGLSLIDDNILPDGTTTPPQNFTTLNTGSGDYPATVTHFEQRRWFASTANAPQNVWGTRSATDSNLTSSVPSRDDDALTFKIRAQQQNAIRFLVPLVDLVALTVGGEFRIFADPGPAITPGTLSIKPQAYSGAALVQPALTAGSALYVQSQGSRVREIAFDPNGTGIYKSTDVSLFAPHLFNGYQIKELAYSRAPDQTLWAVRTDGKLLGMTYVPEQQVYGWHQHDTDGTFESCAVIPEGAEDVLYVVVRRTVNGTARRYIERLVTRLFTSAADAFFVDSGLTYSGAAATVISGLRHLEGKTVSILADGAVVPPRAVTDGAITLDQAATKVQVGLPYNSDLQTLPAQFEIQASGQGTLKNVSKVYLRVTQSSLVKGGPLFTKLTEYPARAVSDPYGAPPALRTGELAFAITPNWNTDGAVCVRQDQPLPLTVLSVTVETAIGG
jgi:hypothetical protein